MRAGDVVAPPCGGQANPRRVKRSRKQPKEGWKKRSLSEDLFAKSPKAPLNPSIV